MEGTWLPLTKLFQGCCDCQGEQVVPYSGYLVQRPGGAKIQPPACMLSAGAGTSTFFFVCFYFMRCFMG